MITGLDPVTASAAELDWIYDLRTVCDREVAPAEPPEDRSRFHSLLRFAPVHGGRWYWRAGDAGVAWLWVDDGATHGMVKLYVDPSRRRRGTGSALLATAVEQARAVGCRLVRGRHGGGDGGAFCAAIGATDGIANLRNLLVLTGRDSPTPVIGYALRSWLTRTPAELVESMVRVHGAMNDAPRSAGVDPDHLTVEQFRDAEETVVRRGVQTRVTAALDPAGEVVGFTELRVAPEPGAMASTEDTAVLPAHRGRGLATWMKTESLRLLKADRPDVVRVMTENAETNAPMLAVNYRLGFTTVGRWPAALLPI